MVSRASKPVPAESGKPGHVRNSAMVSDLYPQGVGKGIFSVADYLTIRLINFSVLSRDNINLLVVQKLSTRKAKLCFSPNFTHYLPQNQ